MFLELYRLIFHSFGDVGHFQPNLVGELLIIVKFTKVL